MDERRAEIAAVIGDDPILNTLVDEMVYLEKELDELRELPKIKVHPTDKEKQKATEAGRLYRELLGQYINILRLIIRAKGIDESEEETPLRKWANARLDSG